MEGGIRFIISTLEICDVEYSDSLYSCDAQNTAGNDSVNFQLSIRVQDPVSAEVVIHPYASTAVNGGSTTLFTCLSYGIPTPSIVWSQGGYHLSNGTHTNIEEELVTENDSRVVFVKSLLRICNTELADSGSYSCIANNTGGNSSFDFELTLLDEGIVFYTENCAWQLYIYMSNPFLQSRTLQRL